jgi:DNA-binding CsgD family transcriptional regulator
LEARRSTPKPSQGFLVISASGRVRFMSQTAARLLQAAFGPLQDNARCREALANWTASGEPTLDLEKDERRFVLTCIDTNRKGARACLAQEIGGLAKKLTPREMTTLYWMAMGKSNDEIAVIMGVKVSTVKTYVRNILDKLEVYNRATAVACYGLGLNGQEPNGAA